MQTQRGFALVAAMMVLALLSILGAAAIQSTTLEVKISAHDRDARSALYVAEAGLEEGRYYVARGWGKIRYYATEQVEVTTVMPAGFSWDGLGGFTLVDQSGLPYEVASASTGPPNVIVLAAGAGDPAGGRFVVHRPIPAATWNAPYLDVTDPAWVPTAGDYTGWLLWNGAGGSYKVQGSTTLGSEVRLRLSTDPGAGPYALSLNPWLGALESGTAPPEDARTATPEWDREFDAVGRAEVTARRTTSGTYDDTYLLTSRGLVEHGPTTLERLATLRVYLAGRPDQRVADWTVR